MLEHRRMTDAEFAEWWAKERERQETERENQRINDLFGGFDTMALGYYVNPNL